ncbi:MAG: hypothetical protein RIR12_1709 [Bacteroidota bacterium]|jgi:hypothetical protein
MYKHLILYFVALSLLACNIDKKNKTGTKDSEVTTNENKSVEKVNAAAASIQNVKENLGTLSPISNEELQKMLPVKIAGALAENTTVENSSGVNIASADYKINDSTAISLSIIDCAGPAGVGIYTTQHLGMAAAEGETEDEYTKAVSINGNKGYEHCYKEDNDCSIVWFAGGRYLVSIEGVAADKLKQLAGEVKIK